ncbi:hypothetical protein [Streptococcus suis]|uniref:hypothetical protein n=1 Tax=Streptococcus suis TaxID=1307 RepID=UPI001E4C197E|nr:hypothetical protein [Streptococcus suis]
MFIFAFPGMGKTTLAKQSSQIVDLEMSDIKYDNSSVRHLNKEERKSTPRPIKDKNYKKIYVDKAYTLHEEGKTVLVAMNFFTENAACHACARYCPISYLHSAPIFKRRIQTTLYSTRQ